MVIFHIGFCLEMIVVLISTNSWFKWNLHMDQLNHCKSVNCMIFVYLYVV